MSIRIEMTAKDDEIGLQIRPMSMECRTHVTMHFTNTHIILFGHDFDRSLVVRFEASYQDEFPQESSFGPTEGEGG